MPKQSKPTTKHLRIDITEGGNTITKLFPEDKKGLKEAEKYLQALKTTREAKEYYQCFTALRASAKVDYNAAKWFRDKMAHLEPAPLKIEIIHVIIDDCNIDDIL